MRLRITFLGDDEPEEHLADVYATDGAFLHFYKIGDPVPVVTLNQGIIKRVDRAKRQVKKKEA